MFGNSPKNDFGGKNQIDLNKEFAAKPSEARSSAKSGTKNLKSSNPKGSLLRAGGRGVWGEGIFARPRFSAAAEFRISLCEMRRQYSCA